MLRSAAARLLRAASAAAADAAGPSTSGSFMASATTTTTTTTVRRSYATPTVFDRMIQLYAIDAKGNRHALNALEGQTVAEVLSDSGLFPDEAFMPNVWDTSSVDCHVLVAGPFLPKLPPLSDEDAGRQRSAVADYARQAARDNSRFGRYIRLTPELNGMTVALGHLEPWQTW
jgi:hypothetical protein